MSNQIHVAVWLTRPQYSYDRQIDSQQNNTERLWTIWILIHSRDWIFRSTVSVILSLFDGPIIRKWNIKTRAQDMCLG